MSILSISKLGLSVLREVADEVADVNDPVIQTLIVDMLQTCEDVKGAGIAASQVNRPLRMFVIESRPDPRYPDEPVMPPTAIINPKVLWASSEMIKDMESCLSIPGVRGLVIRHKSITVSYTNRHGEQEERTLEGFPARVFQHEYDHTNGVLFIDRVSPDELTVDPGYEATIAEIKAI